MPGGSHRLKAAQSLVMRTSADKLGVRQFIRELEKLRGGDSDAQIGELLGPLYELVGDQKSLDALKQAAGR